MSSFTYARLYTDEHGESHFEDVSVPMDPFDFAPPAPPVDVASLGPASRLLIVGAPDDWSGDEVPHPAPARQMAFVLTGDATMTTSDAVQRAFGPGQAILVEDTSGKGHTTRLSPDTVIAIAQLPEPQ